MEVDLVDKLPKLKTCSKETLIQLVEKMKKTLGSRLIEVENVYVVKNKQNEYMCCIFRTYKTARSLFNNDYIIEQWPLSQWKLDDKEIDPDKDMLQQLVDMEKLGGQMSSSEMAKAVETFGKVDNVEKCGWIMPDGSMLHFEYNMLKMSGKSHAQIYNVLDEHHKSAFRKIYMLDDSKLANMNDSPVIDFCVQSGMIRCHVSNSHIYIQIEVKPTNTQKYVLIDIAEYVKKSCSLKFNADIECNGKLFQYNDKDIFSLRFINDIFSAFC